MKAAVHYFLYFNLLNAKWTFNFFVALIFERVIGMQFLRDMFI